MASDNFLDPINVEDKFYNITTPNIDIRKILY